MIQLNLTTLPTSFEIDNTEYPIRSDWNDIVKILTALQDVEVNEYAGTEIMLTILYPDYKSMPREHIEKAAEFAVAFIDMGIHSGEGSGKSNGARMMWEKDLPLIISAVNNVLGYDVRSRETHWWTFLSAYYEIRESLFSEVISIRGKMAKHQKLEKAEKDFYNANRSIIDIETKYTSEEEEIFNSWIN